MIIMFILFIIGILVIVTTPYMADILTEFDYQEECMTKCLIIAGVILDIFSGGFIIVNAFKKQ